MIDLWSLVQLEYAAYVSAIGGQVASAGEGGGRSMMRYKLIEVPSCFGCFFHSRTFEKDFVHLRLP